MKKLLVFLFTVAYFTNVQAQPTITNVFPLQAKIDSIVTITGTNFSTTAANNIVYFGAVKATVTNATNTQLQVKVPLGASYAPISVTTNALTATANMPFDVLFDAQGTLSAGSFPVKIDSSTNTPYRVLAADLDGDGKPEIVFGNATNAATPGFSIFRNTTLNDCLSFGQQNVISTGNSNQRIHVIDIDGDGKKDIVAFNYDGESFSIYKNTSVIGNISFSSRIDFTTMSGTNTTYANIDDIDGDGKPDIVVSNYPLNGFEIYRNLSTVGNINFDTRLDYTTQGTYPTEIAIADLNNDGKKDIVIGNSQQYTVSVFQNVSTVGNILLATSKNYAVTLGVHGIGIADLNNDGKLDIVTADFATPGAATYATTITVLQNNTTAGSSFNANSFLTKVPYTVGSGSLDIKFGDLNGDGKTDVLVGNYMSPYISLLTNNSNTGGNISLASTININTGNQAGFVESCDLNLDGIPDIIASNYGSNTISVLTNSLPVLTNENLLSFTATAKEKNVLLAWQLTNIADIDKLTLQYSTNAKNWENSYSNKYVVNKQEYLHTNTSNGNNYYRLLQTTKTGKQWYSEVRTLNFKLQASNILLYPNPSNNGLFTVQLDKLPTTKLNYKIANTLGQIVRTGIVNSQYTSIDCSQLPKGNYLLNVENNISAQMTIR